MMDYQEEKRIERAAGSSAAEHRIAVVTAVSGSKMQLKFDGEDAASGKYYKGVVTASTGDRVLCARVSGTYVVLGAILD